MPGPMPKDPTMRQRRNRTSTRAVLEPESNPIKRRPPLPDNPMGEWNDLTVRWWKDVWSSPLSGEFLRADLGSLFRLAILVDKFWKTGKLALAKEIRLQEREFGLTPMSRRRLQWQVTSSEEASDRLERRRAHGAQVVQGDPREALT